MEGRRAVPVEAAERGDCGDDCEPGRRRRNRDRDAGDPAHAAEEIHGGEAEHDQRGEELHRHPRQVPLMERRRGEQRGEAAGRDPAPPVTDAGEVREHRAVRPERLGAARSDAADPVRPHHDQLDPAGKRHPGEDKPEDEQWHCGAALAREERADQKERLVRPTHRERGGADPADRPRVPRTVTFEGGHPPVNRRRSGLVELRSCGTGIRTPTSGSRDRRPTVRRSRNGSA